MMPAEILAVLTGGESWAANKGSGIDQRRLQSRRQIFMLAPHGGFPLSASLISFVAIRVQSIEK